MEVFLFFILVIIFFGVLIGGPITLAFFIYRWLKRKGYVKLGFAIATLIIAILGYQIYTAIYPLDDFYKEDFEYYSKLDFPASGSILSKNASYPDIHGKYSSAALVEFSEMDYHDLLKKTNFDKTFVEDSINCYKTEYFKEVTMGRDTKNIIKIVKKGRISIGFFNDKKTVIIERSLR